MIKGSIPSKKIQKKLDVKCLISKYKRFKKEPKRVFILKDFNYDEGSSTQLLVLLTLGLIEIVPVRYYAGDRWRITKQTKGYRLVRKAQQQEVKGQ